MRSLAIAIATGWFWFLFMHVGPMTSARQALVGLAALVVSCALSALVGLRAARRPRGAQAAPGSRPDDEASDRCASSMRRATSSARPATRCSNPPTR